MRHNRGWAYFAPGFMATVALFAATGCGEEETSLGGRPSSPGPAPTRQTRLAPPPSRQPETGLLTTADGPAPVEKAADPLTDTTDQFEADDGLASASGPKMPTNHSHWLRGRVFNARVSVRLNGNFLGEYSAPIDKDITMRLRPGIDTVTFTYRPLAPGAIARLELVESEHTPPIPPLATFRSPDAAAIQGRGTDPDTQMTTQTDTFIAR